MRRCNSLCVFVIVMSFLVLTGCGGGGGGGGVAKDIGIGTIGPEGGTVSTQGGGAQLAIPANALATSADITIETSDSTPPSRALQGTTYDFDSSAAFGKAVQAKIRYAKETLPDGAVESSLRMYRKNGNAWEGLVGVVDTTNRTVSVSVNSLGTLTIQADNQFAGKYSGSYTGALSGTWSATVNVDGSITATATGGFSGSGTMGYSGASTMTLAGSGSAYGYTVVFSGKFEIDGNGDSTGQGTWRNSANESGTWKGSRTGK